MRIVGMIVALALVVFLMYFYLRQTQKALLPADGSGESIPRSYIEHARESVDQLNEAHQRTQEAIKDLK